MVVSEFRSDRIFYRKALRSCDGSWRYFEFEYPAAQKRGWIEQLLAHPSFSAEATIRVAGDEGADLPRQRPLVAAKSDFSYGLGAAGFSAAN